MLFFWKKAADVMLNVSTYSHGKDNSWHSAKNKAGKRKQFVDWQE